jgi:hypothetical protein
LELSLENDMFFGRPFDKIDKTKELGRGNGYTGKCEKEGPI